MREVPEASGLEGLSVDHILAYAKGGRSSLGNAQPMHKNCNASNGARCVAMTAIPTAARQYGLSSRANTGLSSHVVENLFSNP